MMQMGSASRSVPRLLVGDNPFQHVHHLSQAKGRGRPEQLSEAEYAAGVVRVAHQNGAQGLFFTASPTMLQVLQALVAQGLSTALYAIIPHAFSLVRRAAAQGIVGLGRRLLQGVMTSADVGVIRDAAVGMVVTDPERLMRSLVRYEISYVKAMARQHQLQSVLLHELATDTALALNMAWLFRAHIEAVMKAGLTPGFETRNLPWLVRRFQEWKLSPTGLVIAAPFNSIGFQMNPSREECEAALRTLAGASIVAFSILASGYLSADGVIKYVRSLPGITAIAVGVSSEIQAQETFASLVRQLTTGDSSDSLPLTGRRQGDSKQA